MHQALAGQLRVVRALLNALTWSTRARGPGSGPEMVPPGFYAGIGRGILHGRGWVRTSDLSRVKEDEEGADSGVNTVDKPNPGDGG